MSVVEGMTKQLRLFSSAELRPGQLRKAVLPDQQEIAVCRIGDAVYAFDDMCSHGASSLSEEGELDGFSIVCGWHAGAFDVRTGAAVSAPCTRAIQTYKVEDRDGDIFVLVKDEAEE